jgi:hypothetical protein
MQAGKTPFLATEHLMNRESQTQHIFNSALDAEHDDPFGVLGMHHIGEVWVVRSLRPDAKEIEIVGPKLFQQRCLEKRSVLFLRSARRSNGFPGLQSGSLQME